MPTIGDIVKGKDIGRGDSHKYIWVACPKCGKERWLSFIHLTTGRLSGLCLSCSQKGKRRSSEDIRKMVQAHVYKRGVKSTNWKGGRRMRSDGYIQVLLQPNDFFYSMADKDGYAMEHRLVVAQYLGRNLHLWEIVHHKGKKHMIYPPDWEGCPPDVLELVKVLKNPRPLDANKLNNDYSNLQLVSDDRHKQITVLENRIKQLEKRVTLLEAENAILRASHMLKNWEVNR